MVTVITIADFIELYTNEKAHYNDENPVH